MHRGMEHETAKIVENLRANRISQKISLANTVGISHSHLYHIESKKVVPSVDLVIKLAKALNTNLVDLLK